MDYILRGNDKDVTNVLKEQRIRINRGMIQLYEHKRNSQE